MAKRIKRMKNDHGFLMLYKNPLTGKMKKGPAMAKVLIPSEPLTLDITANGVLRSKRLKGRGSTQLCSGAVCVVEQQGRIYHPVTGTVDFQDSRAFLASKEDGRGPTECYGYQHDDGWFVKINDEKGGHDKLLQMIADNDGQPLQLHLKPIGPNLSTGRKGSTTSGPSGPKRLGLKGHHLRAARLERD
jgi:hypothetical protein